MTDTTTPAPLQGLADWLRNKQGSLPRETLLRWADEVESLCRPRQDDAWMAEHERLTELLVQATLEWSNCRFCSESEAADAKRRAKTARERHDAHARALLSAAPQEAELPPLDKGAAYLAWESHPIFVHAGSISHFDAGWSAALAARQGRAEGAMTNAARDVLAERVRQISREGYDSAHDDEHGRGELAKAAACYALGAQGVSGTREFVSFWPWNNKGPSRDQRGNLVRAGALILAEIERLDRATPVAPRADGS